MSTLTTLGAVIGGLVLLGGAYLFMMPPNDAADPSDAAMMEKNADDPAMMEKDAGAMMEQDAGAMMEKDAMEKPEGGAMMEKPASDGAMMEQKPDAAMAMSAGAYEAYAPEKLANANGGDVVLFFRASWCPSCRAVDADIRKNAASIPAGLTILDVDYDTATALRQKYGVTYQHTFVQVDASGTQIAKWSGSPTLAALAAEVQ